MGAANSHCKGLCILEWDKLATIKRIFVIPHYLIFIAQTKASIVNDVLLISETNVQVKLFSDSSVII